ncbi:MAG: polyprenyl synthetase family protein [Vulcanimicrobiaceae bacterium]
MISDMLLYHFGYGIYGPARRGKRLRPQMLMRVALAQGGEVAAALDAASAVEILHNYSLVHDDIEDRDELRHGRGTLWARDGIAQAINTGDAMCALSFLTLARSIEHHEPWRVLAMVELLHQAHRIMCDGQSLDLQFESAAYVDLDTYHRMIACKTAALFEASCALGAHAARADADAIARYRQLGRAYGMAFQIRDDILGIWGSPAATGKVAGNDIARRKWTFPVVWALAQPACAARETIARAYATGQAMDSAQVDRVVAALDDMEAREAARRAVAEPMAVVERHPSHELRAYLLGTLEVVTPA